jgi:hypothetical protein
MRTGSIKFEIVATAIAPILNLNMGMSLQCT